MTKNDIGFLNYKINGTGKIRKNNPVGGFIWSILNIVDPQKHFTGRQRHYCKQQILRILFQRVGVERDHEDPLTSDVQRKIIHDFMDLFGIGDNDTIGVEIKNQFKLTLRNFLIGVEHGSLRNVN